MRKLLGALVGLGTLFILGCSGDDSGPPTAGCPQENQIAGVCAGVPSDSICGDTICTTGVTCAKVVTAGSDAELQNATASAEAGTCIALEAGSYGDATLPAGVSLLGVGAQLVN